MSDWKCLPDGILRCLWSTPVIHFYIFIVFITEFSLAFDRRINNQQSWIEFVQVRFIIIQATTKKTQSKKRVFGTITPRLNEILCSMPSWTLWRGLPWWFNHKLNVFILKLKSSRIACLMELDFNLSVFATW